MRAIERGLRHPGAWWLGRGFARRLLIGLVVAALCGCQMDLHTKVTEADANEMLGALLAASVDARKHTPDGGKTWSISVEESQAAKAIEVLRENALPRERRATLGDLFKKEGLISSPVEERVRFLFGVQQGLAETLSKIDGVMVARVHIVLPNNDPLATTSKPSSAAVFVKHRRGVEMQTLVPAIKSLVVHSVEGLEYNDVTVTPVAAEIPPPKPSSAAARSGISTFAVVAGGGAVLLVVAAMVAAFVVFKAKPWPRPRSAARSAAKAANLVTTHGPVA